MKLLKVSFYANLSSNKVRIKKIEMHNELVKVGLNILFLKFPQHQVLESTQLI